MKKMQRLKGIIEAIDNEMVTVSDLKSENVYYFHLADLEECEVGQKVDLLISLSTNSDGISRILMHKKKPKVKPYKMANHSTLLKHMIKTCERLKVTVKENPELDTDEKIREQIEFLEKGIKLFS
ncbi:MAG: hypothetical protein Kow0029_28380 [Candidatus Rifleibacteriota bacterium]